MPTNTYLDDIFPLPPFDFSDTSDHEPMNLGGMYFDRTGILHTEETKRQYSIDRKGEGNSFYGKNHSEETRKKMSDVAKERPRIKHTEESKKKMSVSKMGNTHCVGRKISEKHRQAIIESNKTRWK